MNYPLKPLLLAASALLLATACTNEDNQPDIVDITRPIDLRLSPAAPVTADTKVAIDGTDFASADEIGLYLAWTDGATAQVPITSSIAQTTWQGNAFSGESLYWQNTADHHTLYAYYPYADGVTGYQVPVTLPAMQTATDEASRNILYGTFSGKAQSSVTIEMGHCMSVVNITLEKGAGYGATDPLPDITDVVLSGSYHTSGTLDLATGEVTADAAGTTSPITTYLNGTTYRAILLPGETLGNIVITTEDGTTYTYRPTETVTTKANTQYNFTLQLNKAEVTLGDLDILQWGTTEATGGANMNIPAGN
ncbi:MAG TPA: fimbrillin family protein [Candidatus Bacteroides merdigallinarum]|uniref:Fimbrillin family protein n=1 Tax=Candidatus Bacteroides merdigallinarum TaxID=2838473 RepID=A0A9D2E8Z4_9BACE|nr:fimbrillin family protein [Candidatus Bacteroides merdigallinarum]